MHQELSIIIIATSALSLVRSASGDTKLIILASLANPSVQVVSTISPILATPAQPVTVLDIICNTAAQSVHSNALMDNTKILPSTNVGCVILTVQLVI